MKGSEYRRIKKTKHVWSHQNVLAVQKVQYFVDEMEHLIIYWCSNGK